MTPWPVLPLGEIFNIVRGGSPRPIDDFITDDPGGINWVTIGDASEGSKYIERTRRRIRVEGVIRSREVRSGDFLLTNSMSFGRPYIMRTGGCIHDGWLALGTKRGGIDQDFFFHLLGSSAVYSEFERLAAGATVKNLNIELVKGVRVPVPPLSEQRRIAEVLDRAETLRAQRRQALAHLDALAESIFIDMFGDPETNNTGLSVVPLGSICIRITDGTHQPPRWTASGHPFLFVSNIISGELNFDTAKFISEETHAELTRRCPIELDDVLYSTVGSYGVPAIVRTQRKFAFQRHIAHLKPDPRKLNSEFLRAMLSSSPLRRQADRVARGVAQKTVNLADIKNFRVFHPRMESQVRFRDKIAVIDGIRLAAGSSRLELDSLFAALQHRAFRGAI